MSRSGYVDDNEDGTLCLWRANVARAIKGKRGQALLREMAEALDAMPVKELFADELEADGGYCALGVVGAKRGLDMARIDPHDAESVAGAFKISDALAREIVYENDEQGDDDYEWRTWEICGPVRPYYPDYGRHEVSRNVPVDDGPARRWKRMREWVAKNLAGEQQ